MTMHLKSQPVLIIVGAAIGGVVSFILACWKRRSDGRDQFHAVTADMRSKLEDAEQIEAFIFESIPILRQAIYHVRPFIRRSKWECLHEKWREYQGAKHPNPEFQGFRNIVKESLGKQPMTAKTISELLDSFDKLVG